MVDLAVWDTEYKKVWLKVKACSDVDILHEPHAWATTQMGYAKSNPVPYFCKGVIHD